MPVRATRTALSVIGLLTFTLSSSAVAATIPPGQDTGSVLQQQALPATPLPSPGGSPIHESKAPPQPPAKGQVKVHVVRFVLAGRIAAFPKHRLLALLAPYRNADLTLQGLRDAAAVITDFYHRHGYFLARAYLPRQDVSNGVVTVAVMEGVLEKGGITIETRQTRLVSPLAHDIVAGAARPGRALRKPELERGLLLLNDLPGISATASLRPGKLPGSTDVVVHAKEGPLVTAHIGLDNSGTRYTGRERMSAGAALNDPSGYGDRLSADASQAIDGKFLYFTLGYSLPVGVSGLRTGVHYSHLRYGVGKEFADLHLKGKAQIWSLDASYPLIRSTKTNLYATAAYNWQHLYNESLGASISDKHLYSYNLGLNFNRADRFAGGGYWRGGVQWTAGTLDLSDNATDLLADQAAGGAHTNGNFAKLNWHLTRIQRGIRRWTLLARLRGQVAFNNLDTSQKMQLGGPTGIRAYPTGEAAGDDGVLGSVEARYLARPASAYGPVSLFGFYDWGSIIQYHDPSGINLSTPNSYSLAGYGAGVSLAEPGRYDLRAYWAHTLGSNPGRDPVTGANTDGLKDTSQVWLTLQAFFSWEGRQ